MATTKPSRSINMTRLLLSLDSTPENRQEIVLANKVLSDPAFQAQLKRLDLNVIDNAKHQLNLDWVSVEEAVEHLNESQTYIEKNFASNEIIFEPKNVRFKNIIIKKRTGKAALVHLIFVTNIIHVIAHRLARLTSPLPKRLLFSIQALVITSKVVS